jgi:2'-5' RNA ligase
MSPALILDAPGSVRPNAARDGYRAASFEDAGPSPYREDPVFFLLYPPSDVARRMTRLAAHLGREYNLPKSPADPERLHVSLCFLCSFGQLTHGRLAVIDDAVASLAMPPFLAEFERVGNFGRTAGPLVLRGVDGTAGITMLRDELTTVLSLCGFRGASKPFEPHVTLNYKPCAVPEQAAEGLRWTVCELVLVCSLRGRRRHRVLRRWPLLSRPKLRS